MLAPRFQRIEPLENILVYFMFAPGADDIRPSKILLFFIIGISEVSQKSYEFAGVSVKNNIGAGSFII